MRGHLFPAVAILESLRERGHEIAVLALADEMAMLRGLGLEAAQLSPRVEALAMDDWRARTPWSRARRATRVFCARASVDGPELSRAIREVEPDALLVDVACFGALAAAEAWGGPWASFCPFPLPLPSPGAPPYGPGLRPARRLPGQLRDGVGWGLIERAFDRLVLPELNQVRAALGVTAFEHAFQLFTRPPLLLYMTAESFEYRRDDWPTNVEFVGPCAWDPPGGLPAELAEAEDPLVLVTTSSDFQDDARLVRVATEALAGEPLRVVASVPAAEPAIPHGAVLARAGCAITHGGMGATQKALATGVPVCAVPFGRDQFEVARRVEEATAGTRLPAWRLNPERLQRKVKQAMARRPGAERLASSFAKYRGGEAAAEAFERLLP